MCALQDGGVLLVATTRENLSPSLVLELLRRIGGIIKVRPAAAEPPAGLSATFHAEHEDPVLASSLACENHPRPAPGLSAVQQSMCLSGSRVQLDVRCSTMNDTPAACRTIVAC